MTMLLLNQRLRGRTTINTGVYQPQMLFKQFSHQSNFCYFIKDVENKEIIPCSKFMFTAPCNEGSWGS